MSAWLGVTPQSQADETVPLPRSFTLSDLMPRASDLSFLSDPESRSISEPIWKDARVAEVQFSYRGDQRKNRSWTGGQNDFENYEINPEGVITGGEILGLARPMERALYDALIGSRISDPAERARSYSEYLKRSYDQAVGVLTLNRILDHEAMKRKLLPRTSQERIDYVKRVALVRFAIETGKVATRTVGDDVVSAVPSQVAAITDQQLYAWMKEGVGNQTLRFKAGWRFIDGGLETELGGLRESGKEITGWPEELRISFRQLPDTVEAFSEEIARQLDATYQVVRRQYTWRVLIAERKPLIQWDMLFSVSVQDERKFYETLKAREFSVQPLSASAHEWTLSGTAAAAFSAELERQVAARETQVTAEIRAAGIPSDPAAIAALRARVKAYRQNEVRALIGQLLSGDFQDEVASGALRVVDRALQFASDGVTEVPADDSVESKQKRAAFDQRFSGVLLPRLQVTDSSGALRLMVLEETVAGAPQALPIDHPRVRAALRGMMQMRKQGFIFREVAYDLLRENPLQLNIDSCGDSKWPCASRDLSRIAEVLFPETLFPGESLGTYGPASSVRIPSTLLEQGLRDKVMTISLDLLQAAFQAPNEIEVSPVRW
jgi:hypothetical protein